MILGEMEFTGYKDDDEAWVNAGDVKTNAAGQAISRKTGDLVTPVKVAPETVEKQGRRLRSEGEHRDPGGQPGLQRCPRAAATSSIPTRSSASMAPTPCGSTRCSWAPWRPSSRGAWKASPAFAALAASGG